jgi:SAM-dependent methyltransferase
MSNEEITEQVRCNLCGSGDSRVRFAAMDGWPIDAAGHYAASTDKFGAYGTIRQCRTCGLVYTSPRIRPERMFDGYSANEDTEYVTEGDSRSMNAYLALAVIRRHAQGGRLLDVGCNTGFFLNAARLSYDVAGVEPSAWARKFANEKLHLGVAAGSLEQAKFPDASFDVTTLIDVIEHLPDPKAALCEVARVTKPGGILYLVTPDVESISARLLRGRWWGLRPAHIYYFSPRTLRRLLYECGFEVVSMSSYGRIFTWQYWLSRLSNYPRPLYWSVETVMRLLGIQDKFLYLDTRDSMQVVARRKPV